MRKLKRLMAGVLSLGLLVCSPNLGNMVTYADINEWVTSTDKKWMYRDYGDGIEIKSTENLTGGQGASGQNTDVVIPATLDGKTVRKLADRCFSENTDNNVWGATSYIKSLIISDTVTYIGEDLRVQLDELVIPKNVTYVGNFGTWSYSAANGGGTSHGSSVGTLTILNPNLDITGQNATLTYSESHLAVENYRGYIGSTVEQVMKSATPNQIHRFIPIGTYNLDTNTVDNYMNITGVRINGTHSVGETIKAEILGETLIDGVEASNMEGNYQWRTSDSADGTFVDIPGATNSSYVITDKDKNKYIQVVVTGTGGTYGTGTGIITPPDVAVVEGVLTDVSITGTLQSGETLKATVKPMGATATYQWQRSTKADGTYTDIEGANQSKYTLNYVEDKECYIRVVATGIGKCSGTVIATTTEKVALPEMKKINSVSIAKETYYIGDTLTAITDPVDASVAYQWYIYDNTEKGVVYGTPIKGAISKTYTIQPEDTVSSSNRSNYIYVKVSGLDNYTGSTASTYYGVKATTRNLSVSIDKSKCSTGDTLTAITDPVDASVDYQWYRYDSSTSTMGLVTSYGTKIEGATKSTYRLKAEDIGSYVYVITTGTGNYTGAISMAGTFNKVIQGMDPIIIDNVTLEGNTTTGETLTAVIKPLDATADIEWQKIDKAGKATVIAGATGKSYVLTDNDVDNYIKVIVTGTGEYDGCLSAMTTTVISGSSEGGNDKPNGSDSKLTDSSKNTEYETNENFVDEGYTGVNKMVDVDVIQSAQFTVLIPKKIVLNGKSGSGDYTVKVMGDIPGNQEIVVAPKTANVILSSPGKSNIIADITQDKTKFSVALDTLNSLQTGVIADGTISVHKLSAGKWTGNFDFSIGITEKSE